ncbi:MAG: DsrH/TusB family sulfur metabolism protein [Promethearchaeota archaeon]
MEEKSSIVCLYGFSLRLGAQLDNLLNILKQYSQLKISIKVVLIHDSVIGTSKKSKIPSFLKELLNLPLTIYAMIPDLNARGMNRIDLRKGIEGIGYEELVDILTKTPKIISWM